MQIKAFISLYGGECDILNQKPLLWETGVGSDVMKPIAAPIVGGMITSTIHVLILVPVFFVVIKERALKRNCLKTQDQRTTSSSGDVTLEGQISIYRYFGTNHDA